jgi:arylformamidase
VAGNGGESGRFGGEEDPVKIYDLSPAVDAGLPVWPGDTPYSARWTWRLADGDTVNLSAVETTPHLGSHADAPIHTEPGGAGIGEMPLLPYLGPCRVVEVPRDADGAPPRFVEPRHLVDAAGEPVDPAAPPRLLFKTVLKPASVADRSVFPERFTALSPELAEVLVAAGTLLVGLDAPSVDPFDSTGLPVHHILAGGGVANLEGLVLDAVPPGLYELIALPLRLAGLDASPVRAVLRELSSPAPNSESNLR